MKLENILKWEIFFEQFISKLSFKNKSKGIFFGLMKCSNIKYNIRMHQIFDIFSVFGHITECLVREKIKPVCLLNIRFDKILNHSTFCIFVLAKFFNSRPNRILKKLLNTKVLKTILKTLHNFYF